MSRKAGFTLVELLIVVGIIALLIALIMPSLGRARELAKRAVCASKLSAFSRGVVIYVADYEHYPLFAPWPWGWHHLYVIDYPGSGQRDTSATCAWPKFYGVMQSLTTQGTHKSSWGCSAYFWEVDEIWEGALCPAMDAARILDWADRYADRGDPWWPYQPTGRVLLHTGAIGYQWNFRLRGKGFYERWTPEPDTKGDEFPTFAMSQNVDWAFFLPNDGTSYAAQAVHPGEISKPSSCAEAWDSPDLETLDWTQRRSWQVMGLHPGFFCGPQTRGTDGWALLNGARHPASPNVLYADGAVRTDADRPVKPSELGACPSGNWDGLKANSWQDYNDTFGTVHHIIPRPEL